jgi:hypothetical protein
VTIHRELLSSDDGPPVEGMEMQQRMSLRGAQFKVSWELVACERPTHAEWKGRGPARSKAETEYTLEALPDGRDALLLPQRLQGAARAAGRRRRQRAGGGLPEKEAIASLKALKKLVEGL